jgi:hypothetical protein
MTEPTGGALGMKQGEHFSPTDAPREKFYTIGRARYRPFPIDPQRDDVDFLANAPLASHMVYDLVTNELGNEVNLDDFRELWKAKVLGNVIAHSHLRREMQDARHPVYTWDVKLMAQMPKRQHADLDINGDLAKVDYIDRLRKLRTVLTNLFEPEALRVMFRGWIDLNDELPLNPVAGNPFMRPFDDVSVEGLDYSNKYPVEFRYMYSAPEDSEDAGGMFMYFGRVPMNEGQINGIQFMRENLEGGKRDEDMTPESMIRMSAFGQPSSKLLNANRLQELAETAQLFVTGQAFAFVDGNRIVAYGWAAKKDAKRLIRIIAEERGSDLEVVVPSIAHKKECLEHAWIDLDLLKFWVKHFDGRILYTVPDLTDDFLAMTRKKKRSKYAMMYAAARSGAVSLPHEICEITKTPHEFIVGIRVEL